MPLKKTRFRKGVVIAPDMDALDGVEGEIKVDSSDNRIKATLGAASRELTTNDQSQTLSNKTLTSPVINTGVSGSAIDTDVTLAANSDTLLASQKAIKAYVTAVAGAQNEASEIIVTPAGTISSTNVQLALQELDTDIQNHLSDATDAHDASAISNVPAGSIAATDVQAAINELDTDIQNHITDSADAHDASAISNVPSGNLAATDVQAALNELQGDIDTNTSGLSNHLSDSSDAHDASAISVVPTGNLAASDVQAALNELQGDADAATTHIGASTDIHGVGVGNSVVGTGTSQVLTNKTITGADIRTPVRSDVKQDTKANLITYALTASNGQLCFATDTKEMFQVVDTLLESVGGGAGIGGVDILFSQTFEEAALTDFTQTGLSLSTSSPIHGAISALMTHGTGASPANDKSFKQVIAVDEKFRGQAMLLELNVKSTASAGNVTLNVYDETNAANIVASEQLTLSSDTGGIKVFSAFTIPVTCLSLSYTITALPEAGSPVTRIDDILCQLNNASLLETSVTVPVITTQSAFLNTTTSFTANAIIVGTSTSTTGADVFSYASGTGIYTMLKDASVEISYTNVAAGAAVVGAVIIVNGAIVGTGTSPSTTNLSATASFSGALATGDTFYCRVATNAAINHYISVSATAHETSDVAIPLTQSGIVQEADSTIRLDTGNSYGSTYTVIRRFVNLVESVGSDVTYIDSPTLGASFTINTDGVYTIDYVDSFGAISSVLGITKNSTQLTTSVSSVANSTVLSRTTIGAAQTYSACSWTGLLVAGDVIRAHTNGAVDATSQTRVHFVITKQGSLKQVSVNTNSKITIPTSELRFEGASAKGSTDTAIVKFDTQAKIRGDAFSVVNTAANGTVITMLKAGKLDVSASVRLGANALFISKNQSNLTTTPLISELISSGYSNVASSIQEAASSVFVNIGDTIRVVAVPISVVTNDGFNTFSLVFQEQEIQVSVSNTLPQFSASDSCVRLSGAGASPFGSTATTTRRFSSVVQNLGTDIEYIDSATLGGQFVAKASGIYNVSYSEISAANASVCAIYVVVNGVEVSYDVARLNTAATVSKGMGTSWQGFLNAGDIVTATNSGAANNDGNSVAFTMSKVGKPNVTGVDVTPFVNVPQPISQSMFSQQASVSATSTVSGSLTSDSGDSILSYSSSTGRYTALKRCTVQANYTSVAGGNVAPTPYIRKNGVEVASDIASATTGQRATASWTGVLSVGEYIDAYTVNTSSGAQYVSVSATATSDTILTAPETFSTDTAALTYASSAAYTLATLNTAPVGTFITFTYAINSNARTQTTTAPTQTTADMNANGLRIFTRAFNAASIATTPSIFAVQIGKGLKGLFVNGYANAQKLESISLDAFYTSSDTSRSGLTFKEYNELTGVLILDAGYSLSASVTAASFRSTETPTIVTSGYLVVNASKNPALTGLGLNRIIARATSTAGGVIGTALTLQTLSEETLDTHGAWNGSLFTAPEAGYYQINAALLSASVTLSTAQGFAITLYRNGVLYSTTTTRGNGAATTYPVSHSDVMFLAKEDTVQIYANASVATTQTTAAGYNFISIQKVSI